jgi:hypothetical protein
MLSPFPACEWETKHAKRGKKPKESPSQADDPGKVKVGRVTRGTSV